MKIKEGTLIKNKNGTSDQNHPNGWINAYTKYNKLDKVSCCICSLESPILGAHILYDSHTYIVPMCHFHNKQHGLLAVNKDTILVPPSILLEVKV